MNTENKEMIFGIDGLARFLNCSRTTASKLGKGKLFPRYQVKNTRQIFFKPEEILSAIKVDDK